jgi:hypothetical protein
MSKDKYNEAKTEKDMANQSSNVEKVQTDTDTKELVKKIKLTNSLTTDYYNTFR